MLQTNLLKQKISALLNKEIDVLDFTTLIQGLQKTGLFPGVYNLNNSSLLTSTKTIKIEPNLLFDELPEETQDELLRIFEI